MKNLVVHGLTDFLAKIWLNIYNVDTQIMKDQQNLFTTKFILLGANSCFLLSVMKSCRTEKREIY